MIGLLALWRLVPLTSHNGCGVMVALPRCEREGGVPWHQKPSRGHRRSSSAPCARGTSWHRRSVARASPRSSAIPTHSTVSGIAGTRSSRTACVANGTRRSWRGIPNTLMPRSWSSPRSLRSSRAMSARGCTASTPNSRASLSARVPSASSARSHSAELQHLRERRGTSNTPEVSLGGVTVITVTMCVAVDQSPPACVVPNPRCGIFELHCPTSTPLCVACGAAGTTAAVGATPRTP